jgi:glycosyltransferase involved in cell wall biosynthesis
LIIPARNDEPLTNAMTQIAEDESLRQRLGPAGKAYITEHYQADRTVRELHEAYSLVGSR